jgi:anti-anti-sigma factor
MKDFAGSILLGDFARAFNTNLSSVKGPKFPCCPVVAQTKENSTIVGRFSGDIGLPQLAEFKQAMHSLIVGGLEKIVVDFASVNLTRTAVGALVNFAASVQGNNKKLYLYRPSRQVRDLLAELELTGFFAILENEDDILIRLNV